MTKPPLRRLLLLPALLAAALAAGQGDSPPLPPPDDTGGGRNVFVVTVEGMINDVTLQSLQRRIDDARAEGADLIVLELDTPGGLVSSALDICTYLKNLEVETLAWIRPDAYSAGAMIAIACDGIIMGSRSKMGDCAPIMIGPQGLQSVGETERAKIVSPILEEFRDSAQKRGYPLALCEVMVKVGPPVYQIRKRDDKTIRYVYEPKLKDYGLKASDLVEGVERKAEDTGVLRTDWELLALVNPENELLTLNQDRAVEHGFARRIIADDPALAAFTNAAGATITRLESTWSEDMVSFLSSPQVVGLLMTLFMLGAYMEMQSPGLGLPGLVAVCALAVLLGAPYLAGLANVMELGLILVGMVLIAIEVFVIPGTGIAGIGGLLLMFLGLLLTFVQNEPGPDFWPQLPQTWQMLEAGLLSMMVSAVITGIGLYYLTKHFGSIPMLNRLVLSSPGGNVDAEVKPDVNTDVGGDADVAVGDTGRAMCELRPAGQMEIGGNLVDVVSNGTWVPAGRSVRIVEVHGNRVVVEEA